MGALNEKYKEAVQLMLNNIDRKLRDVSKPLAEPERFERFLQDLQEDLMVSRKEFYKVLYLNDQESIDGFIELQKQIQQEYNERTRTDNTET